MLNTLKFMKNVKNSKNWQNYIWSIYHTKICKNVIHED